MGGQAFCAISIPLYIMRRNHFLAHVYCDSNKMWTHLHRLVLWTSQCASGPPRLKDSQCRGKKTWIKAFLLKYILIAGVNNLHNKSQIILITLYHSVIPFQWKIIYCLFQNHYVLKVSTVLQINHQPQLYIFQSKQNPKYTIPICVFITGQKPTVSQISCLLHACCYFQNA